MAVGSEIAQGRLERLLLFLLVAVGPAVTRDVAFVERIRRVRDLLQRFVVPWLAPPTAPPTGSPAHAVVFRPGARQSGNA